MTLSTSSTVVTANVRSVWTRPLLLLLILIGFSLQLHELTRQDIWWDEARNIDVALRPLTQIATAPELDIHPPLYFWLLHLWLRLGPVTLADGPLIIAFVARFLSVACGLLAATLLFPLGRRIYHPSVGLFALLIGVTSPFWLAESQETRMYTLSFALLTAAAWFLLPLLNPPPANRPPRPLTILRKYPLRLNSQFSINHLFFIVFSTAALLAHYNTLFILVAWYGWWGICALFSPNRWQRLRPPLFCGLSTVILFLPVFPIALRQIPTYANPNLTIPTLGDYLWQNWHAYLGGYAFDGATLAGYNNQWLWTILAIALSGLLLFFIQPLTNHAPKGHPRITFHVSRFTPHILILVWLFGGLGLYYIAVLDRGAFNVRYSSLVTPPLYLLLGVAVAGWWRCWRPLGVVSLLFLGLGLGPALYADLYDARFAREDIGDLTDWLRAEAGPNDLILVDQKYPFGFYYGRYAIDGAVTPAGPEAAPARYLFVDVNRLDARLNEWAGKAERVFWVQWFESDTDPRHAVRFLLDKAGARAGERDFQGYRVDWWQLQPPTTFVLAESWQPFALRFGTAVETVAVSLPSQPTAVGGKVSVVIRWQRVAGGEANRPLKARIALYDEADNRLVQADDRLLNDRHRLPPEWQAADQPLNLYTLDLPTEVGPGTYAVRLLVYDGETQEALPLFDAAGQQAGIEAALGTIEVTEIN